jgi:hypothetical protein
MTFAILDMDRNDAFNSLQWQFTPRELRAKLDEEGKAPWTSEQLSSWFNARLPHVTGRRSELQFHFYMASLLTPLHVSSVRATRWFIVSQVSQTRNSVT